MSEWININTDLPTKSDYYLLCNAFSTDYQPMVAFFDVKGNCWFCDLKDRFYMTHWRNFPKFTSEDESG